MFYVVSIAQIVSLSPSSVGPDDPVTLIFDASEGNGELVGADKVYIHHGVVIDGPTGTGWNYVIGNWGQDDGVGEMAPVPGETDKWQIEMTPSIRAYYNVPNGENIFRLSMVFRSADGNTKGTTAAGDYGWGSVAGNGDIYVDLNVSDFVSFTAPLGGQTFLEAGESLPIEAFTSSPVSSMKIWVDEGSGFEEKASVSSGTTISYNYMPSSTGVITIKVTATINGEDLEAINEHNVVVTQASEIAALPNGVQTGINYNDNDDSRVTLVLEAPGKAFAYVVGDFTNWNVLDAYQMKQTPDGEMFWLEIEGLTSQQDYVFQYWVDLDIKIGDPYAEQTADPWNDQYIEESVFPDLPEYDKTEYGIASVLRTGQTAYQWDSSEDNWERPDVEHLVIYELLVRDFLASHSYDDLIDTLSYIKELGVDAIELMPFNEFEGNESWGYNPSYFFAPDKYYGTADDLRRFIETCHQMDIAVIMDIVLNHAFRQNPMVQLYFDYGADKPTADNPWFNREYIGPFSWGYDFNHESDYTKAFIDRVNTHWIEEYHIDGYRFDFTKGFTNYAPGGNIDGFDQSRIDILKRMADVIWDEDPEAYVILEHWGPFAEEQELGDYGMKMWANRSYDFVPMANGTAAGSYNGMERQSHVSFFNSHDERRIAEHMLTEGQSEGAYNVKDPLIMYERAKLAAAFCFLYPGPKMLWQFDELGYDIDINFNGRTGNKPLPWGPNSLEYYEDPLRQHIYDAYRGILDVRNQIGPENLAAAETNHNQSGYTRVLSYDMPGTDLMVIGNFGLTTRYPNIEFTQTGTWYDYFSGDSIIVPNVNLENVELAPGQWNILTTERLSEGMPGVVEIYENPVTITPYPFTKNEEITITFDATKASPDGTDGLVGADKVYFHSGVVLEDPFSTELENVVGTLTDDGIGEMTEVSENIWEITITPKDYYGLAEDEEAFKIGMYFRDANNVNLGKGFRDSDIFFNIQSDRPFVTIEPEAFEVDDEITLTFNARRGNGELIGADKVYIHSSAVLTDTNSPWNSAWTNTVGNWGQDDGVGQMSKVAGEADLWEITLTPEDYYGLNGSDVAYWISAVFRSADGNTKGTGEPGPIENGIIHTNQDFFIQNQLVVNTDELSTLTRRITIFPNPTRDYLSFVLDAIDEPVQIELFDLNGKQLSANEFLATPGSVYELPLDNIAAGLYLVKVTGASFSITQQLVKL
jgi:1,4-alpha-glucan branching enzyme